MSVTLVFTNGCRSIHHDVNSMEVGGVAFSVRFIRRLLSADGELFVVKRIGEHVEVCMPFVMVGSYVGRLTVQLIEVVGHGETSKDDEQEDGAQKQDCD